jgi:hypothetical protein
VVRKESENSLFAAPTLWGFLFKVLGQHFRGLKCWGKFVKILTIKKSKNLEKKY